MKRLKESESQLLEEADKLSQELHEKTLMLHSIENEKNGREASMRGELSGATQVTNALKAELERRQTSCNTVDWFLTSVFMRQVGGPGAGEA